MAIKRLICSISKSTTAETSRAVVKCAGLSEPYKQGRDRRLDIKKPATVFVIGLPSVEKTCFSLYALQESLSIGGTLMALAHYLVGLSHEPSFRSDGTQKTPPFKLTAKAMHLCKMSDRQDEDKPTIEIWKCLDGPCPARPPVIGRKLIKS